MEFKLGCTYVFDTKYSISGYNYVGDHTGVKNIYKEHKKALKDATKNRLIKR